MKIEVNVEKRYFVILLSVVVLFGLIFAVHAYNPNFNSSVSNVATFGLSADEVAVQLNNGSLDTVQDLLAGGISGNGSAGGPFVFTQFIYSAGSGVRSGVNGGNAPASNQYLIGSTSAYYACFLTYEGHQWWDYGNTGRGQNDECSVYQQSGNWYLWAQSQDNSYDWSECQAGCIPNGVSGPTSSANNSVGWVTTAAYAVSGTACDNTAGATSECSLTVSPSDICQNAGYITFTGACSTFDYNVNGTGFRQGALVTQGVAAYGGSWQAGCVGSQNNGPPTTIECIK